MSTVADAYGKPFIRGLKSISQNAHGFDQAPTSHELAYVLKLDKEGNLKDEMKKGNLTDAETEKLLGWLKIEKAEIARRTQTVPTARPVRQISIVLPCGHLKSKIDSTSHDGKIHCYYHQCGGVYEYQNETLVSTERSRFQPKPTEEKKSVVDRILGR